MAQQHFVRDSEGKFADVPGVGGSISDAKAAARREAKQARARARRQAAKENSTPTTKAGATPSTGPAPVKVGAAPYEQEVSPFAAQMNAHIASKNYKTKSKPQKDYYGNTIPSPTASTPVAKRPEVYTIQSRSPVYSGNTKVAAGFTSSKRFQVKDGPQGGFKTKAEAERYLARVAAVKAEKEAGPKPLEHKEAYNSVPRADLTPESKRALRDYGSPSGYRTVNPYLNHNGEVFDKSIMAHRPATPAEVDRAKTMIAAMDKAFDEAPPTTKPVKVSRGVYGVENMFGAPGSRVGQQFSSQSYVSTTTAPGADTGLGYGYSKRGKGTAVLTVNAPAGTKFLHGNDFEQELILPRDSNFNVRSDSVGPDGTRYIELEHQP